MHTRPLLHTHKMTTKTWTPQFLLFWRNCKFLTIASSRQLDSISVYSTTFVEHKMINCTCSPIVWYRCCFQRVRETKACSKMNKKKTLFSETAKPTQRTYTSLSLAFFAWILHTMTPTCTVQCTMIIITTTIAVTLTPTAEENDGDKFGFRVCLSFFYITPPSYCFFSCRICNETPHLTPKIFTFAQQQRNICTQEIIITLIWWLSSSSNFSFSFSFTFTITFS